MFDPPHGLHVRLAVPRVDHRQTGADGVLFGRGRRGLGQIIAERGSFLKDIGMFDSTEFGITAKDARAMAVSTRKLIELSFLALLDAGIDYRGKNVGCYASATAFDMQSVAEPVRMP